MRKENRVMDEPDRYFRSRLSRVRLLVMMVVILSLGQGGVGELSRREIDESSYTIVTYILRSRLFVVFEKSD